jgi:hypothetical protein
MWHTFFGYASFIYEHVEACGIPSVGIYRQACSGIPLAVRFLGRDRLLWNSMVQGTQRFRQVWAASCVIPYVMCGCLYCLRCWCVSRGSLPALIYRGDRVTWKVLAEYSWSPTTTQSGSFLCTTASSTPMRVTIKEVRYIHELSLTLEHSMSISSPLPQVWQAPELFVAEFCRRRVLGWASSSTSNSQKILLVASGPSFRYVE